MLEIGPGTGANLQYYPETVRLIGLEPNPYMQKFLQDKANKIGRNIEIHTGVAEHIPLPEGHVDAAVGTLVLCSVDNLQQSLSEIKRVLKPGGSFCFIEHVAASENTWLRSVQNCITPCWQCLVDGCHPNRETGAAIKAAGFKDVQMENIRLQLPVVAPHIIGSATKSQ